MRMPLTTVFWIGGPGTTGPPTSPRGRSFNLSPKIHKQDASTDLIYLSLPPAQSKPAGVKQGPSGAKRGSRNAAVAPTKHSGHGSIQTVIT